MKDNRIEFAAGHLIAFLLIATGIPLMSYGLFLILSSEPIILWYLTLIFGGCIRGVIANEQGYVNLLNRRN